MKNLSVWSNIDNAPKDGRKFLGFAKKGKLNGQVCICFNNNMFVESVTGTKINYLTHWMPLPEGPE